MNQCFGTSFVFLLCLTFYLLALLSISTKPKQIGGGGGGGGGGRRLVSSLGIGCEFFQLGHTNT